MLPRICYSFSEQEKQSATAPYLSQRPTASSSDCHSISDGIARMSNTGILSHILQKQTNRVFEASQSPCTRSSHRTALIPDMIYSPAEKPREPLNEVSDHHVWILHGTNLMCTFFQ